MFCVRDEGSGQDARDEGRETDFDASLGSFDVAWMDETGGASSGSAAAGGRLIR